MNKTHFNSRRNSHSKKESLVLQHLFASHTVCTQSSLECMIEYIWQQCPDCSNGRGIYCSQATPSTLHRRTQHCHVGSFDKNNFRLGKRWKTRCGVVHAGNITCAQRCLVCHPQNLLSLNYPFCTPGHSLCGAQCGHAKTVPFKLL